MWDSKYWRPSINICYSMLWEKSKPNRPFAVPHYRVVIQSLANRRLPVICIGTVVQLIRIKRSNSFSNVRLIFTVSFISVCFSFLNFKRVMIEDWLDRYFSCRKFKGNYPNRGLNSKRNNPFANAMISHGNLLYLCLTEEFPGRPAIITRHGVWFFTTALKHQDQRNLYTTKTQSYG